jgi:hypothetical protein
MRELHRSGVPTLKRNEPFPLSDTSAHLSQDSPHVITSCSLRDTR